MKETLVKKMSSWCSSQEGIQGHTEQAKQADLLEKDGTITRWQERAGSEKRDLGIYYTENESVEYSGLKGGGVDTS